MKQIIVTGGTGFLGNNLCRYLLRKYKDKLITNFSKETYASNPRYMRDLERYSNYKFIDGDINNSILFMKTVLEHDTEIIYHLAASTHVDRSFKYAEEFLRTNVLGTLKILEVLRHLKEKPFLIYMGTDEVLGDVPEDIYYSEDISLHPENPYSSSKACAELYCIAYEHSFNLSITRVRSMNMFGPYQHPEKLIAKIITHCISDQPFYLYEGKSIRGWIYVEDTCEILDLIGKKKIIGELFHIPPTTYLSVPEVKDTILKIMNKEYLFKGYLGRRLKDDFRYALSGEKLIRTFKWKPRISFIDGIEKTIKWYKENKDFWIGLI
jgi:dTDP-glucose 4,6-dehydratase